MKAEKLLVENIHKEWINTDMGSGWKLKLYCPLYEDFIEQHLYLDEFNDEEWEFEEFKDNLLEYSITLFKEKCSKYLDYYEEYLLQTKLIYYSRFV